MKTTPKGIGEIRMDKKLFSLSVDVESLPFWLKRPVLRKRMRQVFKYIKKLEKRIAELKARSIDCPNRPASKTEVEMAKRLCDYQDEVRGLKQRIADLEAENKKLIEGHQLRIKAGS